MTDVENNTLVNKPDEIIKVYKTKDYVRRAVNKYRKKKYATDEEYRAKQLISCKNSHEKNRENYKEQKRLYMRDYRAKKKAVKQATATTEVVEAIAVDPDLLTEHIAALTLENS